MTSNLRCQIASWRVSQPRASASLPSARLRRWVRPSTSRRIRPASSRTRRWRLIAGFETPRPPVASPTVAGPRARRSTIPLRTGLASAPNTSSSSLFTIWLTVAGPARRCEPSGMAERRSLQPVDAVEVTVLVDNAVDILLPGDEVATRAPIDFGTLEPDRPKLLAEHGLSLLLTVEREGERSTLLYDAGLGAGTAVHNMDVLQLRLADLRAVVQIGRAYV